MPTKRQPSYYILDSQNPKRMLLGSLEDPSLGDCWLYGRSFSERPSTPVIVGIIPGYERAELMDYFGTPPVMSDKFYKALVEVGVDNLDVYDAVLASEDDKTQYKGFKAVNIIGLVAATDRARTKFAPENPSRLIDATIDQLAIDPDKARGLYMFRLAEYVGAVVVHEKVKAAIEKHGFKHVVFYDPAKYIS